jgi:hypothetical protein
MDSCSDKQESRQIIEVFFCSYQEAVAENGWNGHCHCAILYPHRRCLLNKVELVWMGGQVTIVAKGLVKVSDANF